MIVPTSAKVGIAGFFNNNKARLQKCDWAFFMRTPRSGSVERLSLTVHVLRPQLRNTTRLFLLGLVA